MHAADILKITKQVDDYMISRKSHSTTYNVVNALDKLGYLQDRERHVTPDSTIAMIRALREINDADNLKAQDVDFNKSHPMAEWICWAIDTAAIALAHVEKNTWIK